MKSLADMFSNDEETDLQIAYGLTEQMSYPAMQNKQYEFTTKVVRSVLEPWLRLHFGERCDEFEHGCECCQRWAMADRLLAYDRVGTPEKLEQEIKTLQACIDWRKAMVADMERRAAQQEKQE